jgi:hypothetical protein
MSTLVQSPLPSRQAVRDLLEGMTGRDVTIADGNPVPNKPTNVIAVYVNVNLGVQALAVVDLAGAARLGGALGMLPIGGVEDAIDDKDLYGSLRSNCYEILNVLSAVFNVADAPHVKLYEMYATGDAVPADILSLSQMLGCRMDVTIDVDGYGQGLLSLVAK